MGDKKKNENKQTAGGPVVANGGYIVMQSEEAQQLENLRNAMSLIYSGIDQLDNLVLSVENNERICWSLQFKKLEKINRGFSANKTQIYGRLQQSMKKQCMNLIKYWQQIRI